MANILVKRGFYDKITPGFVTQSYKYGMPVGQTFTAADQVDYEIEGEAVNSTDVMLSNREEYCEFNMEQPETHIEGMFTSHWSNGETIETRCKLSLFTGHVFYIEVVPGCPGGTLDKECVSWDCDTGPMTRAVEKRPDGEYYLVAEGTDEQQIVDNPN